VPLWRTGERVRCGEPVAQFVVDVSGRGNADAVSEQRVELRRRLQSAGRRRCDRQDEPEVDAAAGAGLNHRELLAAAKAQVALLRRNIERPQRADLAEEGVVQRPKSGFRARVKGIGRVRRRSYAGTLPLPGKQGYAVGGAVREPVLRFHHRHDLVVFGQARAVDDREPVIKRLAVCRLDVADLGLQGGVNIHQVSSVGLAAAPSAAI
jgi:hypothetical protein